MPDEITERVLNRIASLVEKYEEPSLEEAQVIEIYCRVLESLTRFSESAARASGGQRNGTPNGDRGRPLPPPDLRLRVAGSEDASWFDQSGKMTVKYVLVNSR